MIEVRWTPPAELDPKFTKVRIERAAAEQGPYTRISEIDFIDQFGDIATQFVDTQGSRGNHYIVRFFDPNTKKETDFIVTFFPLTPREKRLTNYILQWIPDILIPDLTDESISIAFKFSINSFNVYPPETKFTIDSFPSDYEQFLVAGAQVNIALLKYLKIGIRDFSYSDMGLSLNIERGTKIAKAAEDIARIYYDTISQAKWNFIPQGIGLGSIPLPVSVGASLNRGLLNVLDLMNQLSR